MRKRTSGTFRRADLERRDGAALPERVRVRRAIADARFGAWVSGRRRALGSDDPVLVEDHRTYKALSTRRDLSLVERFELAAKADVLLRVRFYDGAVRRGLEREHGGALAKAFREVGLPPLRLATAPRSEAVARLAAFEAAATSRGALGAEMMRALAISMAIRVLDSDVIPTRWCTP